MLTHCALMDQIIHQRVIYPFISSQNNTVIFPTSEHDDANCFVHQRRDSLQVAGNQQLMMALAWIVPQEARMFKFFPSVIFVDATMDTNNEGRPLLSMVDKDTCGKTITILRLFCLFRNYGSSVRCFVFFYLSYMETIYCNKLML